MEREVVEAVKPPRSKTRSHDYETEISLTASGMLRAVKVLVKFFRCWRKFLHGFGLRWGS